MSRDVLTRVHPATDAFLRLTDIAYVSGVVTRHSLSISPRDTLAALVLFASIAVFVVGAARYLTPGRARRLVASLIVLGTVLALVAIAQRATWNGRIYWFWTTVSGAEAYGPFVNRNHFAGWMLMALPLALGYFFAYLNRAKPHRSADWGHRLLWLSTREGWRAILIASAIFVMGLSLVLTLSRAAIAAFALAVAFSAWVVAHRVAGRSRRAMLVAYLAVLVGAIVLMVGIESLATRFADLQSMTSRRDLWRDALGVFKDFPVAGTGLGTYRASMFVYQTIDRRVVVEHAHNDYLQLLAEGGVLVAGAALLCAVLLVREIRRRFQQEPAGSTTYWIRVGAVTGIMAIALQELVDFSLRIPGNDVMLALLTAISIGKLQREHPARDQSRRLGACRSNAGTRS
jgi:O-antigen ligase